MVRSWPVEVLKLNLLASAPVRLYMSRSLSLSVAATGWPMSRTVTSAVPPSVSVKLRDALAPSVNTGAVLMAPAETPTSSVAVSVQLQ